MAVPEAALRLYALPPSRFVAERDALAKTLAAKREGAAEVVRRLGRPTGLAWVLNRLARERAPELRQLLTAGDRVRTGQRRALAGKGADDLRAAGDELRARARALRMIAPAIMEEAGRRPDPGVLARIELLLRVAACAPGPVREALRRGVLEREPDLAPADLTGLAVLGGGGAAGAARGASRGSRRAGEAEERRSVHESRERERARRAAQRELARTERAARLAVEAAERAEDLAQRTARKAQELRRRADAARAEAARRAKALRGPGGVP